MDINLSGLDRDAGPSDVISALASALHSSPFSTAGGVKSDTCGKDIHPRLLNFHVKLNPSTKPGFRNDGTGLMTLPTAQVARSFLSHFKARKIRVMGRPIRFHPSDQPPNASVLESIRKMPFQDPKIVEERQLQESRLGSYRIRISKVQFGVPYRTEPQIFSVEWQKDFLHNGSAFLTIEWAHKLLRVRLFSKNDQSREIEHSIVLRFSDMKKILIGIDMFNPYILFDLFCSPAFERQEVHRSLTGIEGCDNRKYRERVGYIDPAHAAIAPYAPHLRLVLHNAEDLREFQEMCEMAGLLKPREELIPAETRGLFSQKTLRRIEVWLRNLPWPVAFQAEALLRSGLLHTEDLERIRPLIDQYCQTNGSNATVGLIRLYNERLRTCSRKQPVDTLFRELSENAFPRLPQHLSASIHQCHHVTVTPTRLLLEGPYPGQSNSVIRRYEPEYGFNFIRIDFRDEDRLVYRWDRAVDGEPFLQDRVGGTLRDGITLAGRHLEFLAYSSSALRGHAVWFIIPFEHPSRGYITGKTIRASLGDFSGVITCPAKYAARMAQAFTSTEPSVPVKRGQWKIIEDITNSTTGNAFTDGVGVISPELGNSMFTISQSSDARPNAQKLEPSAYQIRFLGFKGMVSIDYQLTGTQMLLRPSMHKFQAHDVPLAKIEVVHAFNRPGRMHLNRPYIMILEDRGVSANVFMELQNRAVKDVQRVRGDLVAFSKLLDLHRLGRAYHLNNTTKRLAKLGLDLENCEPQLRIMHPFFRRLVTYSTTHVLRDIKYHARIPVPDSWQLVGVVDEGPEWRRRGLKNVRTLAEGEIFACVQEPGKEPVWLKGKCLVSRSPTLHPGDIQPAYAIGRPADSILCAFSKLVNCVVFSAEGERPLPSCLAGGDLDGDLYDICMYAAMKPKRFTEPAVYPKIEPETLPDGRHSQINDVINFVVEYIHSDVLGLLSVNHSIIADQSREGVFDKACLKLSKLCSQAVDYPKSGRKVDIRKSPRRLIPYKPDWQAGEDASPRATDYYRSERAVGQMFRAIELEDLSKAGDVPSLGVRDIPVLSTTIKGIVQPFICVNVDRHEFAQHIKDIFECYHNEIQVVSVTHTLTNDPSRRLTEEEIVLGTILAKCSQQRLRKDRIQRLKTHVEALVRDTEIRLMGGRGQVADGREKMLQALRRVWEAWMFAAYHPKLFGANSFALIALFLIFDIVDRLEGLEQDSEDSGDT